MKKFLKQLFIWFAVLFVISLFMDMVITSGLRKTDLRKYAVWNDIYNKEINADVVVIGSSRAWGGYNTYIIDSLLKCNSYNLGFDGHPFDFQLIRYNTYKRFNKDPRMVILNTEFLSTLGNSAELPYEREQFFPYITDDSLISLVAAAKKITFFDRYLPLYRYFGYRDDCENGIAAFFDKRDFFDGGMHKGYRGNEWVWSRGSTIDSDTIIYAGIDRNIANNLDTFCKDLSGSNITVVMVKSPVYHLLYEKFAGIGISDSVYNSISKKYGIPILNYYNSPINMDSTNFYNPSHLNKKGSELFTIQLCHDIDSLQLLN